VGNGTGFIRGETTLGPLHDRATYLQLNTSAVPLCCQLQVKHGAGGRLWKVFVIGEEVLILLSGLHFPFHGHHVEYFAWGRL
jgi:hypothetical protein